jgi:hypothetical protein
MHSLEGYSKVTISKRHNGTKKFNKLVIFFFISAMNSGVPAKQFTLHWMKKVTLDLQLFVPSNPQCKTM